MNIELARQKMIEQQVRAWDVFDSAVLEALAAIPREDFVPRDYRALAFADSEIPLGQGQFMMTPTIEGRVLQALSLTGTEHVLEIGTGSGFLTACLARLAGFVTSIEIYEKLLKRAHENLADARVENIDLHVMDALDRLPDGRFDRVVVGGSMPRIDQRLIDKLVPGGQMFLVVGSAPSIDARTMDARIIRRTGDSNWQSTSLFETNLPPLVNATPPPGFLF